MSVADLEHLAQDLVLFGVMPLWMAAGFADWLCHRRMRIERSSGLPETLLHMLMLAEMATATLAAAFLQINALVVAIMIGAFVLHELTVYVDLRYGSTRRDIPPIEQLVHSFLEFVPVIGAALVLLFHWSAVESLFGAGTADFALRLKPAPLPFGGMAALAGAMLVLVVLPYAEELWRCWRERTVPVASRDPRSGA